MIENLESYLIGIAIGIRFRANFVIEDQLGKIADIILYSKDAFFNPHVFPKATTSAGAKELFNEQTQDYLHIDNSNVILEVNFSNDGVFNKGDLNDILENFDNQITKGVLREYSITQIRRIGFVRRHIFEIESLTKSFITKTIGNTPGGVNDINLRFSKRLPIAIALVKKDVLDYDNAIFNIIKKANLNEIFMSIDYQSFFDPFLPSSTMIDFPSFLQRANGFNSNQLLTWLNSYYMELEDAKS